MSKFFFYISCLQALFATFTMAETGYGQILENTHISSRWEHEKLEKAFADIQHQSDFYFTYNYELVKKISISNQSKNVPLVDLLKYIASKTDLKFSIRQEIIYVTVPKEPADSRIKGKAAPKVHIDIPTPEILSDYRFEPDNQVIYELSDALSDRAIHGTVTALSGAPLIGATIVVKETGSGTVTDENGSFRLSLTEKAKTLIVSYVGYQTIEVPVGEQSPLHIQLPAASTNLDEVVVIGYGTNSRKKITSSIVNLGKEEIRNQPVTSFDQALAGRLPGVDIAQANGAPGAGIGISIRGVSTISGGAAPLIVVDGVPLSTSTADRFSQGQSANNNFSVGYSINPLSSINPNDIERVEVLKDAAATAIYGSRGSNGVILITTKSGQIGQKSQLSLNVYGGIQEVTTKVDVMDAYEFAEYSKQARDQGWINKDPVNNSADDPLEERATSGDRYARYFLPYLNGEQGLTNTDWQDEVFRTAPIQNYELSASGGTEKLGYYISGNYFDQQGVVINSGLKRYGARLNLNAQLSDKLRLGVNFNPSFSDYNVVQTEQNWWREGVIISALMYHPNLPVRNPDGSLALGEMINTNNSGESSVATIENPVALAELIDNALDHTRLLGNAFVEFDIWENLRFKTSLGVDLNLMDRYYYRPKILNWRSEPAPTATNNYAWSNNSSVFNWLSENTLEYHTSFDKHNLRALVGYTAQKERNKRIYLEGRNFPNDNVNSLNAAQSTTGLSEEREWSLLSYLGRVQYDFGAKYLLSASIRRDGSSRFGRNTKWGWFPSVSAGWRISDEAFFPESGLVSDLKLRASYGLTGNTEIPFYGGTALLDLEGYVLGNEITTGLAPTTSPNANLSWETTKTMDVGVDFGLFNNQLIFSADYYQSNTEDLLLNVTVPGSSGFQSSLQNIGELKNKGFEFLLSTSQQLGALSWNASLNFATNRNEIVALAPGQDQFLVNGGLNDPAFIVRVGEAIGSYYGYEVLGVFESQEQFESIPHLEGQNQGVGDFIYADIDEDGDVDADDRTILGNNNPDFTWGFASTFHYKNIDLSFNIQGKHGFELFNAMHRYTAETWGNNLAAYLSDDAPRPVWGVGTSSHTRPSSWHVEDGSFIRVRNITLGYTLPKQLLKAGVFDGIRIYFSALNPFTFTEYSGFNPEVSNNFGDAIRAGEEFGNYPVSKSFVMGLNVNF